MAGEAQEAEAPSPAGEPEPPTLKTGGDAPQPAQQLRTGASTLHLGTPRDLQRTLPTDEPGKSNQPPKKKVAFQSVLDFMRTDRQRTLACTHFPIVVAYFAVFVSTVLMHENLADVAQLERSFAAGIEGNGFQGGEGDFPVSGHKDMTDIDDVGAIWTCLREAQLPTFIPELGSAREHLNRVMTYSQLIGDVQLQQIRRPARRCVQAHPNLGPKGPDSSINPVLADVLCYPWGEYSDECFGIGDAALGFCPDTITAARRRLQVPPWSFGGVRRLYAERHASKVQGRYKEAVMSSSSFPGATYTVTIYQHEGVDAAMQKVDVLEGNDWIDDGTAWFGMKLFVLNVDLSVYCHIIMNVWFTPNGGLIPALTMTSFPAEPYQSASRMAMDFLWLVLWIEMFFRCLKDAITAVVFNASKRYWKDFWTWVEWGSCVGGFVILVLWPVFLVHHGKVKDKAAAVADQRPPEAGFASEQAEQSYLRAVDDMHVEVAAFAGYLEFYRIFLQWYTLFLILRFFKAFQAQPRLAIVTNTIKNSFTDLTHFLVILISVFMSFAVAGTFLFGHRLLAFSEMRIALNTCFLIMLGSFEYGELEEEYPTTAAAWFWLFSLAVALLLLNMGLAIVLDIYTEVHADAGNAETVWEQAHRVFSKGWSHRHWVGYKKVAKGLLDMEPRPEMVDFETLLDAVGEMNMDQALDLIDRVEQDEIDALHKGLSLSKATREVGVIKNNVIFLGGLLEELLEIQDTKKVYYRDLVRKRSANDVVITQQFNPRAETQIAALYRRMQVLEDAANQSMGAAVVRSKEMRARLSDIHDLISGKAPAMAPAPPGPKDAMDELPEDEEYDGAPAFFSPGRRTARSVASFSA